jgi:nucleoside-diphosphate-sugar epimerase
MATTPDDLNVLVTGSQGYIGTRLVRFLKDRGYPNITGLDAGYYVDGQLYDLPGATDASYIQKDIRSITVDDLSGFDAVVHLAELSNDPLSMHNEANTYAINHEGSVQLAERSKEAGVSRFVYTSSCSAYGIQNGDEIKTEASEPIPQTAYAKCKVLVERDVSALADETFVPTFLRNATAYGPSPRMRFDIVLNNLAGLAWTTGVIRMTSDGTPWRPLVHVEDICRAIACTLEAPADTVRSEIFNVGDTDENYQIREIASIVADAFPGCELSVGDSNEDDNRSYRVSFAKIHDALPDFHCEHTVEDGANQLRDVFEQVDLSHEMFTFRAYTRLKQLQHLIDTGQIDEAFFRQAAPSASS